MQENSNSPQPTAHSPQSDALKPGLAAPLVSASAAAGKKEVPIVFCADANYGLYLPVVVQSIIENSSESYHYQIIVLDCGIKREVVDALQRQIRQYDNFSLHVKNIEDWLDKHKDAFKEKWHLTRAMYGRLFIPELLHGYERVVYSDIDVVFKRDIAELMDIDLGCSYIAAVIDTITELERVIDKKKSLYIEKELSLSADMPCIYSGLLVFGMKKWREESLTHKILDLLERNEYVFPDQDAIITACKENIVYLGQDWTCVTLKKFIEGRAKFVKKGEYPRLDRLLEAYYAACYAEKNVIHYNGCVKPWRSIDVYLGQQWWDYAIKTIFYPRYICDLSLSQLKIENSSQNFIKTYECFGLPIWTVKANSGEKKYLLGKGLRIAKTRKGKYNNYIYILGIKIFSINSR